MGEITTQGNAVALIGVMAAEFTEVTNIHGQQYKGYQTIVKTRRRSGQEDEAIVFCPAGTKPVAAGKPVICYGRLQTFKNYKSGKVLVYVLAELLEETGEHYEPENEVRLSGTLGKGIVNRATPNGKHITDIKVVTPNELREGGKCYVPAICWNKAADEVKGWAEGTQVDIKGRLQSRSYEKTEDGQTVTHTCYEVSIYKITRAEDMEQEKAKGA